MSDHYLADTPRSQRVACAITFPTSIGQDITESALLRLLEARWQFLEAVKVQSDTAATTDSHLVEPSDVQRDVQRDVQPPLFAGYQATTTSATKNTKNTTHQRHDVTHQRRDVMTCWHLSNIHLERVMLHLTQYPLKPQPIDLNDLIEGIVMCIEFIVKPCKIDPSQINSSQTHQHNPERPNEHPANVNGAVNANNNPVNDAANTNEPVGMPAATSVDVGVDMGIAMTLPMVSAPPLLLHWVFSELLITSWLNSLPTSLSASAPHNVLQVPLTDIATDIATVVVNCLDADDAWHITISSDHHHAGLATAALTQLQTALQQIGGDVHMVCDDDALLQTVILPKVPRG